MLAAYVRHAQPIVLTLRYQGCRTQEALQLQWPSVDLGTKQVFFERTKNGEPRTLAMHDRVAQAIADLWQAQERPRHGHVFLNRLRQPYSDTRDYKYPGGNPLRSAHATALSNAKIRPNGGADFRLHDWRHRWASWIVMEGGDLLTVARLGGWKDLRMVQRYAAVSTDHMAETIARVR